MRESLDNPSTPPAAGRPEGVRKLDASVEELCLSGETAVGSDHYQVLFAIGIFLFVITFVINLSADLIVRGIREG